ncbi:uncharacterized protein BX664DRAFT_329120 [Halteromyces radiatus]|uniref:uncharacterized protein n=1 Tax=Halteromyces radiatus TaxID=101107 RepID=UPI002220CD5A|nr:uncharacterized protein BX664DRAFT_329120 [Halteromyces radiatus]KAI8093191.1 hypothetical protein BX664DRAFT_329120 [Halteromyces radiatus]
MTSSLDNSPLYSIISFLVVWTDYFVRIYIRIKAAFDAVLYVARSPVPRQRRSLNTTQSGRRSSLSPSSTRSYSISSLTNHSQQHLPNEVLQLVFTNSTKKDLFHCTMVCQRWHRLVTPILWKDPILPPSLSDVINSYSTRESTLSARYRRKPSITNLSCRDGFKKGHHRHVSSGTTLPMVILSLRTPKYGHAIHSLRLTSLSDHLTDDLLLFITKHCPNLISLDLSYAQHITSTGFQHLARSQCATSLNQLILSFCPHLTDATLISLSMRCDSLETLQLVGCHRITQTGVRSLVAASRQSLQYINMKDCIRVSGRILQDLAILCGPRLLGVDATRICSILHSDIKVLVQHCPRLEQLYVGRNKSQLVCQLQQRIRDEQQQEPWVMPFSSTSSSSNYRTKKINTHSRSSSSSSSASSVSSISSVSSTLSLSSSPSISSSSSGPKPFSSSLSASLLQQRQLSRSTSTYTKPNALDSLLDMLRQYNVNPTEPTSESTPQQQQQQQRVHRSRHLSQPIWQYNHNNSSYTINSVRHHQEPLPIQHDTDEVSQHTVELMMKHLPRLKAVDFSHWTCLTEQLIRRLRQQQGHAIQYIGLEGCLPVTQTGMCDGY